MNRVGTWDEIIAETPALPLPRAVMIPAVIEGPGCGGAAAAL